MIRIEFEGRCDQCLWYSAHHQSENRVGDCHYYPPRILGSSSKLRYGDVPIVEASDFCSKFASALSKDQPLV